MGNIRNNAIRGGTGSCIRVAQNRLLRSYLNAPQLRAFQKEATAPPRSSQLLSSFTVYSGLYKAKNKASLHEI